MVVITALTLVTSCRKTSEDSAAPPMSDETLADASAATMAAEVTDAHDQAVASAPICLITDGYRPAMYYGPMPLFVLIGQPGGGYVVEQKIPQMLSNFYRSSWLFTAGDSYIDIVYYEVNSDACYHFRYDADMNDWLLKLFYHTPSLYYDGSGHRVADFIDALPDIMDMPLRRFNRDVFWNARLEKQFFDAVKTFSAANPLWEDQQVTYTIAVKLSASGDYYEGYIHERNESYSGFIQTIRGECIAGTPLTITVDEEAVSFTIQGDTWQRSEWDADAFYCRT